MLKSVMGPFLAVVLTAGLTGLPTGDAVAQAASPNEIVGIWEAENGNIKFEMFDAGGSYAGRMIYGALLVEADGKTFKKDTLNPDPNLRNRSLEGIVFLTNLKWDASDQRWEGGDFYSGATGRTTSAHVTLINEKMEVRAYMGTPVLGQTMTFRRVQ